MNQEDILIVVKQWLAEWMKDVGTRPNIPVPPVTDVGVGPSHTQQNDPLEESEEQDESQQSEGDQGGDDGADEEEEESVKTISYPNHPDKCKFCWCIWVDLGLLYCTKKTPSSLALLATNRRMA